MNKMEVNCAIRWQGWCGLDLTVDVLHGPLPSTCNGITGFEVRPKCVDKQIAEIKIAQLSNGLLVRKTNADRATKAD